MHHEYDELATPMDAIREYAWNGGEGQPQHAWIQHPCFDCWIENPHYVGPPVPHPEDYYHEDDYTEEAR